MQGFVQQDIFNLYQPEPGWLKKASFVAGLHKPVNAPFLSLPLLPFLTSSSVLIAHYIFCIAELCKVMYGVEEGWNISNGTYTVGYTDTYKKDCRELLWIHRGRYFQAVHVFN